MRVSEVFYSLQGEGILVGTPSVFVRLAGCPLRCSWCDTKYAWSFSGGVETSASDLIETIRRRPTRCVVITGGEPLVGPEGQPRGELADLTRRLRELDRHVTIETSGIVFAGDLACDLMSISPKLSNSRPADSDLVSVHEQGRPNPGTLASLIEAYPCQLKFVVDSAHDLVEIQQLLVRLPAVPNERVLLMPQAATRDALREKAPLVARLCRETGFRFGPRLHVSLWDGRLGT